MNHYNVPRILAAGAALSLLAACAHHAAKPAPKAAAAPAPATVTAPAAATLAPNNAPVMQTTAPERYTVKKGDTLWGIASMYLKDPWRWPDIWYDNPNIKNPHLIFPGDVLILGRNSQGQPTLSVERNGQPATESSPTPVQEATNVNVAPASTAAGAINAAPSMAAAAPVQNVVNTGLPTTKLSPQPRYLPLSAAVTTVPLNGLLPYLNKTRVIGSGDLDDYGYVVTAFDQQPAVGVGEEIYARNMKTNEGTRYEILRTGDKYEDPDSGRTVGYEATYIGDAQVEAWGSPTKLLITNSGQEVRAGDHLVPTNGDPINLNFFPHHPAKTIDGHIVSVLGGVGQIGQYDVLVLDRGTADGVDVGAVLGSYRKGEKVDDTNATLFSRGTVQLPTERSGTLLVFRSFKNASYALVMEATHEIHTGDLIGNP